MPDGGVDLLMGVNETVFDTLAPLTDMEPDDDDTEYPDTLLTVYEYVPLGSENDILPVVDENVWPFVKFTYQVVPDGRPVSVNVTVYFITVILTGVNVIV
jgi:hypothetical protein